MWGRRKGTAKEGRDTMKTTDGEISKTGNEEIENPSCALEIKGLRRWNNGFPTICQLI
jgi:hypothetical protein